MPVTRTKTVQIADAWADDFGGVTVQVGPEQRALTVDEARQHAADLAEAIAAADRWAAENAAPAAGSRN